jgi:hypothetical protein
VKYSHLQEVNLKTQDAQLKIQKLMENAFLKESYA